MRAEVDKLEGKTSVNDTALLLGIDDPTYFKLHAARWNEKDQPLDVFLNDRAEWHGWNAWFGGRHEFNRPYILSLLDFYPETGLWLFGGIYAVENYKIRPDAKLAKTHAYNTSLTDQAAHLIGRLKIRLPLARGRAFLLENQLEKMDLVEVLRTAYTGPSFPGYDKASLIYSDLVSIVTNDREDWKTALGNMKGVYLITFKDGRNYVGSASGDIGIWSRWQAYARTRHGGNVEMRKLDDSTDGSFINQARFTLIESWPTRTDDRVCLLYTSPSPRDGLLSRMPSSA